MDAPPPGPPPPKVPEGYKAVWHEQYKEWFYVNIYTKKSQWDKPTEAVYAPPSDGAPPGPPPGHDHGSSKPTGPEKGGFGSNNPYGGSNVSDDEALARKLQAEEEAKVKDRGASDSYYVGGPGSQYGGGQPYGQQQQSAPYGQSQSPAPYGQSQSPAPYGQQYGQQGSAYGQQAASSAPPEKRGLFSKLTGKLGGSQAPRPPQQQGYGGYPPQQGYGGPPPGHQYGQSYGGGGYQGYYPQQQPQQFQQQQAQKKHGLGGGGGALLGAGAGLVGGALLMDAFEHHDENEYQQGYDQGYDQGDDGGGDDGGDFGGDDGGDF